MKFKKSHPTPGEPSKVVAGVIDGGHGIPKFYALAFLLAFLLIVTGVLYYFRTNKTSAAVCTSSKSIMSEASKAITDSKVTELGVVADKIKALENYEKDPNCLNIIATYYINTSNYTDAKATMDKLALVYDPQKGFSKDLGPKAHTMVTLRQNVDALKGRSENLIKNIRGFSQPE